MEPRPCCITDANIWIDLAIGRIFSHALQLPIEWATTDLVAAQLLDGNTQTQFQAAAGIRIFELSGVEMQMLYDFMERYPRLNRSYADLSALVIAVTHQLMLITGDGGLREAASREHVKVHGILWVFDQLVETYRILEPAEAALSLEDILRAGSRLPEEDCRHRLQNWRYHRQ